MSLSQLEPSTSLLIVDSGIEMKADWHTAKDNLREFTASFKKPTTGSSGRSGPLRRTAANAPAGAVTNRHDWWQAESRVDVGPSGRSIAMGNASKDGQKQADVVTTYWRRRFFQCRGTVYPA